MKCLNKKYFNKKFIAFNNKSKEKYNNFSEFEIQFSFLSYFFIKFNKLWNSDQKIKTLE